MWTTTCAGAQRFLLPEQEWTPTDASDSFPEAEALCRTIGTPGAKQGGQVDSNRRGRSRAG